MSRARTFTFWSLVAMTVWLIFFHLARSIHVQVHVNLTESHLRVTNLVLWGNCQNFLDDPRRYNKYMYNETLDQLNTCL